MRNLFVILWVILLCGPYTQVDPQTTFPPAAKKSSKDTENNRLIKTVDVNQKQISDMLKKAQNVKSKVVYIKVYSKPTSIAKKKYIVIDNGFIVDTSSIVTPNYIIEDTISQLHHKTISYPIITKKSFFQILFQKIKNI
jgi:hypothetical protein